MSLYCPFLKKKNKMLTHVSSVSTALMYFQCFFFSILCTLDIYEVKATQSANQCKGWFCAILFQKMFSVQKTEKNHI